MLHARSFEATTELDRDRSSAATSRTKERRQAVGMATSNRRSFSNDQATFGNQAVLRMLDLNARPAKQDPATTGTTTTTPATPTPTTPTTTPEPMDASATTKKTVTVNHLKLEGSSNSIDSAITFSNTKVYNQANVEIKKGKDITLDAPKSKAIVGDDLVLDEYTEAAKPTTEETALLKENQAAGAVSAYYVKDFSSGKTTGEAFLPKWGVGVGVAVGNKGIDQTFAHELGHVLLDSASHVVPDDTYLMHESVGASKVKLTETQKATIRASAFAK
jgi:hypothetical protein